MTYFLNISQFLLGFLEIFLCFKILNTFFQRKRSLLFNYVLIYIVTTMLAVIEVINRTIRLYSFVLICFLIISVTATSCVLYRQKISDLLLCISSYYFGLALLDLFIIFTMGIILQENTFGTDMGRNLSFERIIALSLGRILLFVLYFVITKIKKIDITKYKKRILVLLIAEILGVYTYQAVYAGGSITDLAKPYFQYLTIVVLITILFCVYTIYRNAMEESKIIKLRIHMLEENYTHLKRYFDESRTLFHDYKAHITLLRRYLIEGDVGKAQDYINRISKPIQNLENQVNTGNETLNLLINYKLAEVKGKGIDFEYDISPLNCKALEMEDSDLFVILYNLLDNSIEACEKVIDSERWIQLSIQNINNMLMISIKNSIQIQPKYEKGMLVTDKNDKMFHGIGMSSAKKLVDKYGGRFDYTNNSKTFEVSITFF